MIRPTIVNQSCLSGSRSGLSCGKSTSVTLSSPYLNLCPYSIHSAVKYQPPSLCPSLYLSLKCMVQPQSVTAQRQSVSSHPVISSLFSFSLYFSRWLLSLPIGNVWWGGRWRRTVQTQKNQGGELLQLRGLTEEQVVIY